MPYKVNYKHWTKGILATFRCGVILKLIRYTQINFDIRKLTCDNFKFNLILPHFHEEVTNIESSDTVLV